MPQHKDAFKTYQCPILIKQNIIETEDSAEESKRPLNAATQKHNSSATKTTASRHSCKALHLRNQLDYSLWKTLKKIKQAKKSSSPLMTPQGTWAITNIEKAHLSAKHPAKVFQPHPSENKPEE
jgi:hypothetical protein